MKSFIDSVQEYISRNFDDLQNVEIIVPNNRTGSTLLSSLKKNMTKVCWAPKITPIKNIFARNTKIREAENIVLTYTLYNVFAKHITISEGENSFDKFYNFGEILLSDFDDIDKYLVDPYKLFCNIADEKKIDVKFGDIEDNLVEILQTFWKNVSVNTIADKKIKSLELWQQMPDIYTDFTEALREKGIGYQGMIYRDFVENRMLQTDFDSENYVFVGFSALNQCEKSLFRHIRDITSSKNGKCLFFWDADKYYIENKDQEAGLFLRADLKEFPMPEGFNLSNSIKDLYNNKEIQVIEVPSSVAQTKIIPDMLKKQKNIDGRTAIILGDEKLLVPLIYTLPATLDIDGKAEPLAYNITMGYPLSYTASASFVQIIMKLAMHRSSNKSQGTTYFNRNDIFAAIMHSFAKAYINNDIITNINKTLIKSKIDYININEIREQTDSSELLKLLFDSSQMDDSFPKYIISVCKFVYDNILGGKGHETESDFMHKIITLFTSFVNALGDEIAFEKDNMYYKLMTSMIKKSNMTFEGKSEDTMQILGFMETRSLDFDNIIMLSMNEDTFPKSNYKDSMIPYNLRKAFSMPSIEFQNSIFAYYFYRLLQRSQHIQMVYYTEGKVSHAEQSRFLTQMEYELRNFDDTINRTNHTTKSYEIRQSLIPSIEISKTDKTMEKIHEQLGCDENSNGKKKEIRKGAFPKLINTYLKCPVMFYFEYIEDDMRKEQSIDDDTSALDFGNLLHESCLFLYKEYIGKTIQTNDFTSIKSNIENAINFAVCKIFNVSEDDKTRFDEAKSSMMIKPLRKYLNKLIDADKEYAPFMIVDLENDKIKTENNDKNYNYTIEYPVGDNNILLKGKIDRMDIKDGILRVIDYKTSNIAIGKRVYDENFWNRNEFKSAEALQVLIYSEIMSNLMPKYKVQPCIISVTNIGDNNLKYKDPAKKRNAYIPIETYQDTILVDGEEVSLQKDVNAQLKSILSELLDKETKLKQTENRDNCKYCDYNKICDRNN
ncbi:MAG: PD-(D/E)XK nuclease family protein [Bacteroidales bacterium]|nr:PD-(D/E)XK nuclease family protein [Bacteroidales bacterium]